MDIILIDFDAVYWRHWHTTRPEDPAEAPAYSTVRAVRGLIQHCDRAIVCVDAPRSWRHDVSSSYKSGRAEKPPHAGAQRANALRMLKDQGVPTLQVDGFEADDLIASATEWACAQGVNVVIATMDKDLHQLVRPSRGSEEAEAVGQVTILTLDKGEYRGPEYVEKRYGVKPAQLGDWLALVGDQSDSIAGVPNVGDKTATRLLQDYESIIGILDAARDANSKMTPKGRAALLDNQVQLATARKLVTLTTDLAVEWVNFMSDQGSSATMEDEAPESEERPAMPDPAPSELRAAEPAPQLASPAPAALSTVREEYSERIVPATRPGDFSMSLEPMTLNDVARLSKTLSDSRLFQATFPTPQGVFAAIMLARAHGLGTMQVLMPGMVHNIKGKIAMSAQMIVGLVLRSGKAEYFECIETTATKATFATKRVGGKREIRLDFTIEEARSAGYLGKSDSSWGKTPKTMLRHRCETELARLVYPDVVGGLCTPQEFEDAEAKPERAA